MSYSHLSEWPTLQREEIAEDARIDKEARIAELRTQLMALSAFRCEALEFECCDKIAEAVGDAAKAKAIEDAVSLYADTSIEANTIRGNTIEALEYLLRMTRG